MGKQFLIFDMAQTEVPFVSGRIRGPVKSCCSNEINVRLIFTIQIEDKYRAILSDLDIII
jgi:hypothetical protein